MQQAEQTYISQEFCNILISDNVDESSSMCAFNAKEGFCYGDIGGPLFDQAANHTLVGVASVGATPCGENTDNPTKYTRVYSERLWLLYILCSYHDDSLTIPSYCSNYLGCADDEINVAIEIITDEYGEEENAWNIYDIVNEKYVVEDQTDLLDFEHYLHHYCLKSDSCYKFTFEDYYGDGLTYYLEGLVRLYVNGTVIFEDNLEDKYYDDVMFGQSCVFTPPPTSSPTDPFVCDNETDMTVKLIVTADPFPEETSWSISNFVGEGEVVENSNDMEPFSKNTDTYCFPQDQCFKFELFDSYKDGFNWNYKISDYGGVVLMVNGETVLDEKGKCFGSYLSHRFGNSCEGSSSPTTSPTVADPECNENEMEVSVLMSIYTHAYEWSDEDIEYSETIFNSWVIRNLSSGQIIHETPDFPICVNNTSTKKFCLPKGSCYKFEYFNDNNILHESAGMNVTVDGSLVLKKWGKEVGFGATTQYFGVCEDCEKTLSLEYTTEGFGNETSWDLVDQESQSVIASSSGYEFEGAFYSEICLDVDKEYFFNLHDEGGNGLNEATFLLSINDGKKISVPNFKNDLYVPLGGCPEGEMYVELMLKTDDSPSDLSMEIRQLYGDVYFYADGFKTENEYYYFNTCLPRGTCYYYTVYDSKGDGQNSFNFESELLVDKEEVTVYAFKGKESRHLFGCPTESPSSSPSVSSICQEDEIFIHVKVRTDAYGSETSWDVTNETGDQICQDGNFESFQEIPIKKCCIPANGCSKFTIRDKFGDGIMTPGGYELWIGNNLEEKNKIFKRKREVRLGECAPTKSPAPTVVYNKQTQPPVPIYNECDVDELKVQINMKTDKWGEETSFNIINETGHIVAEENDYDSYDNKWHNYCLPSSSSQCYTFTIYDEASDGIDEPGGCNLFVNDALIASRSLFGSSYFISFGDCKEKEIFGYSYFEDKLKTLNLADSVKERGHIYYDVSDDDMSKKIVCHLSIITKFKSSDTIIDDGNNNSSKTVAYSGILGALIAIHRWNNRLVKGNSNCPVYFTSEVVDIGQAMYDSFNNITARLVTFPDQILSDPVQSSFDDYSRSLRPHAIIDFGLDTPAVEHLASIASSVNLLHLSSSPTSISLEDTDRYPSFARIIPSPKGLPKEVVIYLNEVLKVQRFGLIFNPNDEHSAIYNDIIQKEALSKDMNVVSASILKGSLLSKDDLKDELEKIFRSKVNFIVAAFAEEQYSLIMEVAGELQLIGDDKTWIFIGEMADKILNGKVTLDERLNNSQLVYAYGDYEHSVTGTGDEFIEIWNKLVSDDEGMRYFNSKLLIENSDEADYSKLKELFEALPTDESRYMYDAIMSLGVSGCTAYSKSPTDDLIPTELQYNKVMTQVIEGVSGLKQVKMNNDTSSRDETTISYLISTIQLNANLRSTTSYEIKPTYYTSDEIPRHKFADPETVKKFRKVVDNYPPLPDKVEDVTYIPEEKNLMGRGTRIVCLLLSVIAIFSSILFISFTIHQRDHSVFRSSQPQFLIMIGVGTLIMASAVIFLTMDDSILTPGALGATCSLTIWFMSIGFVITFSALFSKLWRVNRLMRAAAAFNRVTIRIQDVLAPFLVMLFVNVAILLTWQLVSPMKWERIVTVEDYWGRPISSRGSCRSDKSTEFLVAIICVDGLCIAVACWEAYKARNISTEYSESTYIGIAMASIFQAFFIGIPILFLTSESSAFYFMASAILFVVCMATNSFIFVPKILAWKRANDEKKMRNNRRQQVSFDKSTVQKSSRKRNTTLSSIYKSFTGSKSRSTNSDINPNMASVSSPMNVNTGTNDGWRSLKKAGVNTIDYKNSKNDSTASTHEELRSIPEGSSGFSNDINRNDVTTNSNVTKTANANTGTNDGWRRLRKAGVNTIDYTNSKNDSTASTRGESSNIPEGSSGFSSPSTNE